MKSIIVSIIGVICLSGCSLFNINTELNVPQKCVMIRTASSLGVVAALQELEDDPVKRVKFATTIKEDVVPTAVSIIDSGDFSVDPSLIDVLFDEVPVYYRPYLASALELTLSFIEIEIDATKLGADNLAYLKAFFEGMEQGADIVIAANS